VGSNNWFGRKDKLSSKLESKGPIASELGDNRAKTRGI
jgi:hypothetical protein